MTAALHIICIYTKANTKTSRNIEKYLHLLHYRGLQYTYQAYELKKEGNPALDLEKTCVSADILLLLINPILMDILHSQPSLTTQLTSCTAKRCILLLTTEDTDLTGTPLDQIQQPELQHILPLDSKHQQQAIHFAINMFLYQILEQLQIEKYPFLARRKNLLDNPALPYERNKSYIDRVHLMQQIFVNLGSTRTCSTAHILLLIGKEGAGKTQLALEYAYRTQHIYRFIFWIEARTPAHIHHSYNRICQLLQLPDFQALKKWLAQHNNWLLIADDLSDAETFMAEFESLSHHGNMLLICQTTTPDLPFKTIVVPDLTNKEGLELLQMHLPKHHHTHISGKNRQTNKHSNQDILDLIDYLGSQVATLTVLEIYLYTTESTITKFYQHYRKQLHKQLTSDTTHHQLSEQDPFITISLLNIEQLSQPAKNLLYACTLLPDIPIPTELFKSQSPHLDPIFSFLARDPLALDEMLMTLQTYQLLRRTRDHSFYIPSKIQRYLLQQLGSEQKKHYAEQIIYLVYIFLNRSNKNEYKSIYHHAIYLIQICETFIKTYNFTFFEAFAVLYHGGENLQNKGNYIYAEHFYQTAFSILAHIYGSNDLNMVYPLQILAQLALQQNQRAQAEAYLQHALAIITASHESSTSEIEIIQKGLNNLKSPLN